jgi:hypothetical protein
VHRGLLAGGKNTQGEYMEGGVYHCEFFLLLLLEGGVYYVEFFIFLLLEGGE